MSSMTHAQAQEELASVALGAVDAQICEPMRAHAEECTECATELAAMQEVVAEMSALLPGQTMNRGRGAGIKSRLLSKASVNRKAGATTAANTVRQIVVPPKRTAVIESSTAAPVATPISTTSSTRSFNWLALAAGILLAMSVTQLIRINNERDELRDAMASRDSDMESRLKDMETQIAERDKALATVTGRDVKVVPLTNWSSQGAPVGRMYWNRSNNTWTVMTYNVRQPRPGMTFEVWLITDDRKIPAGTFNPDSSGKAVMHAQYELDRNALRTVAVTEEPMGGVSEPTGPMVIAGAAN